MSAYRDLGVSAVRYPSTKTCSGCGYMLASFPLKIREWTCPACGVTHDRDVNTARNILAAKAGCVCLPRRRKTQAGSLARASPANLEPRPARAGIPVLHG